MRHGRPVHEEEQEESAFVSMTDMMVGFLFIVMLVMVFFATQFREENVVDRRLYEDLMTRHVELRKRHEALRERIARLEETIAALQARIASLENVRKENARLRSEKTRLQKRVTALKDRLQALEKRLLELIRRLKTRDPLEEYLARAIQLRRQLVEDMRRRIKSLYPDLQVEVSPEGDALRFQGEGLFELGSAALRPRARRIIRDLARTLDKSLVCHRAAGGKSGTLHPPGPDGFWRNAAYGFASGHLSQPAQPAGHGRGRLWRNASGRAYGRQRERAAQPADRSAYHALHAWHTAGARGACQTPEERYRHDRHGRVGRPQEAEACACESRRTAMKLNEAVKRMHDTYFPAPPEPVHLKRAAKKIRDAWPELQDLPPDDRNRRQILEDFLTRIEHWEWQDALIENSCRKNAMKSYATSF